ncbi:aminotransferase class V-fold PLP-dependent enzyme [Ancylomarina sp. 16SWW S1-10-2]|uniref:aminotransferase class V-fold PLP-dependent enzyme n=1 Tax=Ancylomarina sp. 16SWW S1-10-2 TaxID=2499681 RepID=UPI0012ADBCEC|nr:aminotransferase class V-fold PLP-dependent enzyme [Ancylomarina sp. 16SWW S1-10-2]MRT93688.1 aminotransferase class V-fold PLP-dependent enzyme [Ancylomarina sp. 16SWW S1-10-2]
MSNLENHFKKFRINTVGNEAQFYSPFGKQTIVYGDWIASGRLYKPLEKRMLEDFGPYVANTHTETNVTGSLMTKSYHKAQNLIKKHCNAGPMDVLMHAGYGMTAVIVKLQRILGLKDCGRLGSKTCIQNQEKPVVFITHMEHHSNQTSWYETNVDVVVVPPGEGLTIDLNELEKQLEKYADRKKKIGSFSACSNVTGIITPYHEMAKLMHKHGGICFVDFAASAPYADIDMHPADPECRLDGIFFSPHKFLGGPGSSGVMIFDSALYDPNAAPDLPGGGTVDWTNRWGEYKFVNNIEAREDGGTPGFLQSIRAALVIDIKNQMGTDNMEAREEELLDLAFTLMREIDAVTILADDGQKRIGVMSFYIDYIHFNLLVRLLNDHFGIQVRGGCACAGTYGHFMLDVTYEKSQSITDEINAGDLTHKPGWVRWSLHPTTTDEEVVYFVESIKKIVANFDEWKKDYEYSSKTNEFIYAGLNKIKEEFSLDKLFILD